MSHYKTRGSSQHFKEDSVYTVCLYSDYGCTFYTLMCATVDSSHLSKNEFYDTENAFSEKDLT